MARVWFETVSGLTPELASFAFLPAQLAVPVAGLSVLMSFQRAILMQARRTHQITVATTLEVGVIAACFIIGGWGFGLVGITAAFASFLAGRLVSTGYLVAAGRKALRRQ
jgi:O-antigen/teichoic acid export membrane protein